MRCMCCPKESNGRKFTDLRVVTDNLLANAKLFA